VFDIIPNWHPIFVHFTVALWSLAVIFHILVPVLPKGVVWQQLSVVSRWNLWLGTGFGIVTAIAGWFAYNSVVHDAPSHEAMTDHRNWALVTLALFIVLTGWSFWCVRAKRLTGKLFLAGLLIGGVLLASTAWRGAEAVYRYGIGVMSLPQSEVEDHDHGSHDHSTPASDDQKAVMPMPQIESGDHDH
jgi:uncharacterized membrane protein